MRVIFLLQCSFALSAFVLPFMSGVQLRPVAAYYTAGTLHNGEIEYDFMIHDTDLGLAFWTIHTSLP